VNATSRRTAVEVARRRSGAGNCAAAAAGGSLCPSFRAAATAARPVRLRRPRPRTPPCLPIPRRAARTGSRTSDSHPLPFGRAPGAGSPVGARIGARRQRRGTRASRSPSSLNGTSTRSRSTTPAAVRGRQLHQAGRAAANGSRAGTGAGWDGAGFGMNDLVYAIAPGTGDTVYAGGHFTTGNGQARQPIARWTAPRLARSAPASPGSSTRSR